MRIVSVVKWLLGIGATVVILMSLFIAGLIWLLFYSGIAQWL